MNRSLLSLSLFMSVLATALLAACSTTESSKTPPPPPPTITRPGASLVSVTQADSGSAVTLEPGQGLVISLAIDATTGLEWSLVDPTSGVLTLSSSKFERALRSTDALESGGAVVWRFAAAAPGATTLNFALRRPRSLGGAVQAAVYNVTVR